MLGHCDPLVHKLMDQAIERLGPRHRFVTHNMEFVKALEKLLGPDAKLEAVLHLLQDWKVVGPEDYGPLCSRGR